MLIEVYSLVFLRPLSQISFPYKCFGDILALSLKEPFVKSFSKKWLCSTHLVNCAFDQTHCAIDQVISCATFDELCNMWSITACTCNRVKVRIRV